MTRFAEKYRVESNRKKNWDYSTTGVYFITVCTYGKNNFFGKIADGKMEYKKAGNICLNCIKEIPKHFLNIRLVEFVVMPNHVHILFHVVTKFNPVEPKLNFVETHHGASLLKRYQSYHFNRLAIKSNQTIPNSINQLKSSVKRQCNQNNLFFSWQPRFYDEIINDEDRLKTIKYYIKNNPKNWEEDRLYQKDPDKCRDL